MIDPNDKQTTALPLDEQPAKRKRGRPVTGKAMTPAEKQKAYRLRQAQKQSELIGAKYQGEKQFEEGHQARLDLAKAQGRILYLEQELAESKEDNAWLHKKIRELAIELGNALEELNKFKGNAT